jgi:hypothetical protein
VGTKLLLAARDNECRRKTAEAFQKAVTRLELDTSPTYAHYVPLIALAGRLFDALDQRAQQDVALLCALQMHLLLEIASESVDESYQQANHVFEATMKAAANDNTLSQLQNADICEAALLKASCVSAKSAHTSNASFSSIASCQPCKQLRRQNDLRVSR